MFSVLHTDGSSDTNPPREALTALLDELQRIDREHGDVAVVNEDSGWSMSAHRDGRLVLEHLSDGGERHMIPVAREKILELWGRLIDGDVEAILTEPWREGYLSR